MKNYNIALVCIDTRTGDVKRYVRGLWGRLEVTHHMQVTHALDARLTSEIERLRVRPRDFPMDHIPEGAA